MPDTARTGETRAAIVTTLRNAGAVIDSFLKYHRAIGFERFYLFFDDPADPDLARVVAHPFVTAVAHDAALRARWSRLAEFAEQGPHVASEVMARQVLNVALAMELARADGMDWLLSIDADELFYSPQETAAAHFARASREGYEVVGYLNYEAVPEKEAIGDYFREVTLFKVQPALLPAPRYAMEQLRALCQRVPQFKPNFYHFYSCGKSAVRVTAQGLEPGLAPLGVHSFTRSGGAPLKAMQSPLHFILHYPCCGFENFWAKYATLGRFADTWWGKHDIASSIGTFHLEARDVVTGDGTADRREAARAFYRQLLQMDDARQIEALIAGGLLARLLEPQRILLQ